MTVEQGHICPLDPKEIVLVHRGVCLKKLDQFDDVIPVHGVAGFTKGKRCKQRSDTLVTIDWLLGMAHPVQAVDCRVWPAMFNQFLNRNGKIAIGLIGIRAGAGPVLTLVVLKPF